MFIAESPFAIRVRRWYRDPTQWTFIAGFVLSLGPIILEQLGLLGLTGQQQFVAILVINALVHSAGAFLNYQSTHVIGTKDEVAASGVAPIDPGVTISTQPAPAPLVPGN